MHLADLEKTLPNGFHDAVLQAIDIDYTSRCARFRLRLLTGSPDAATESERESRSRALLTLRNVLYLVIEAPRQQRPGAGAELWIDTGPAGATSPAPPLPDPPLPPHAFAYWMFVHDWDSFIHFAAADAELTWE